VEEVELDIFEASKSIFIDRPLPVPASVGGGGEVFDGDHVVLVSAGAGHIASVTESGLGWTWGFNNCATFLAVLFGSLLKCPSYLISVTVKHIHFFIF